MTSSTYPRFRKKTKVLSLAKSKDSVELTEHRPISILPVRTDTDQCLMAEFQLGLRHKDGTKIALFKVVNDLRQTLIVVIRMEDMLPYLYYTISQRRGKQAFDNFNLLLYCCDTCKKLS